MTFFSTKKKDFFHIYDSVAEVYDKARPTYSSLIFNELPPSFHASMSNDESKCIVEVGAGTGIFSSLLLNYLGLDNDNEIKSEDNNNNNNNNNNKHKNIRLILVEPLPKMRQILDKKFGQNKNVSIFGANADSVQFIKSNSVDSIFCAQSFHWFANNSTLKEFSRILKPYNSHLVLIWQDEKVYDSSNVLLSQLGKIMSKFQTKTSDNSNATVKASSISSLIKNASNLIGAFENGNAFENFQSKRLIDSHYVKYNGNQLTDMFLSWSYFASQSKSKQNEIRNQICQLFVEHLGSVNACVEIPITSVIACATTKVKNNNMDQQSVLLSSKL